MFSENWYPPAELGCSRVLPLSMAQVGNIRLAHSGVPEFCHCQWRKSETSDLRTRVFPSSGTFKWTQIGNIRFAVVKPEGRLFRDHALLSIGARARLPFLLVQSDRAGSAGEGPMVEFWQNHLECQRLRGLVQEAIDDAEVLVDRGIERDRKLKTPGLLHDLHHR